MLANVSFIFHYPCYKNNPFFKLFLFFHDIATMRTIKQVSKERCPRFPFAIKWTLDHEIEKRKKTTNVWEPREWFLFLEIVSFFFILFHFRRKVATIDLETLSQTADTLLQEKESFARTGSFAKKNCLIFSIKGFFPTYHFIKKFMLEVESKC